MNLSDIFSITNIKNHKVFNLLGLKIKIKNNKIKDKQLDLFIAWLNTKKINKEQLASEIENRKSYIGVTEEKREQKLIVSLTSYPARMYDIHYCLYSLLNQKFKPDEVILWLGEEQFPNREEDVPKKVLDLRNNGLTIKFTEDIKSFKKLIPALKEYPNDIIVTADDDIFYPSDWLEKLYNEYVEDRENIICHRAYKINIKGEKILPYSKWKKCLKGDSTSVLNFFTGAGGVLYPPYSLYKDISKINLFMDLTPNADDVWFWAMVLLNEKKVKVIKEPTVELTYINPERELGMLDNEKTLYHTNKDENDMQIQNVLNYYPQLKNILTDAIN